MGVSRRGVLTGIWLGLAVLALECEAFGQRAASTGAGTQFVPVPFMLPMGQGGGLGGSGGGSGLDGSGSTGPVNAFNNPYMTPMLYGSMFPMSRNQMGWMMLANQAQMTGVGAGRLSGVRPGTPGTPGQNPVGRTAAQKRGSASTPGGLAARYFNRTKPGSTYPRAYFNRQPANYPDRSR